MSKLRIKHLMIENSKLVEHILTEESDVFSPVVANDILFSVAKTKFNTEDLSVCTDKDTHIKNICGFYYEYNGDDPEHEGDCIIAEWSYT